LKDQIPAVFADKDKVHQVLLNLIGNSMKFTHVGGTISVRFFTDGRVLETSIQDNGVGISKDDQSRLFEKFSRLDNSYVAAASSGGTGLGLYISKNLVQLMHGKIWVSSEGLEKGANFTFSLPVANKEVLDQAAKYTHEVSDGAKLLEPVAI
ncbi:ATP-binding protein, partial [Patescibacteria group bacterium]|nr:ATP-binding protein [Patescibacteria group bacterium]